jgi:gamma-glutamylcyclotransferase (GGCT)/AIG2-like uncharacterized protein YtfP
MSFSLFVYGTLRPAHAPPEISDVVDALKPLGPATIRARLYDFGAYPGVILDDHTTEKVTGQIFDLPPDPTIIARLDEYEDYRPYDPANSLFKRLRTTATLPDGSHKLCWVYVYNQPLPQDFAAAS